MDKTNGGGLPKSHPAHLTIVASTHTHTAVVV